MNNKKGLIFCCFAVIILIYLYIITFTNIFNNTIVDDCLILITVIIIFIYFINLAFSNINSIKFKDKLFNSLVDASDTVYLMIDKKSNNILYLSDNVENILGITNFEAIRNKILEIPIVKSELSKWDKISKYVSQMIEYDNPKYNYKMWIKIKIFPYKDTKEEYYIIEVSDATKDHDRQHLLVSQATDIKTREIKLNEITADSYDFEINVNTIINTYDLKYFKKDNLYFGEERSGNYTEGLNSILKYINENDRDMVLTTLSLENLKEHFSKYELDSISIRYRIGSEVKNNIWLESSIFFLSSRHMNTVSILTKNVTESAESVKEQNVLLQNALNEAKNADKAKMNLISTISHDIRTPLTNIIGLSSDLLTKNLNSDIKEDIKNINESSNDVLSIIDQLLSPSKIEKNLIKKEQKNYSILKMFNKLEEISKDYIGNKHIKFNLNMSKDLPVILYGDYKRITQAITKVIDNSVKYTDEGEITVSVRGEKKGNKVNLMVVIEDTGIGIEESKLNEIINSKNSDSGLSYVKRLMKLLDGKLEIESKVNEYTRVTLSFMQTIVEDNKVRELMSNNKEAEEFILSGKKILIVDDNELNLKVTKRLLEPYKVDVTLVESGEECLDLIKEGNKFDLIMLDQMMPGIDGVTTLNKLKEIDGFNTPVVVLTADAMEGRKEQYLSSGFDDYISKPIDKGELSRVLKKFIKDIDK